MFRYLLILTLLLSQNVFNLKAMYIPEEVSTMIFENLGHGYSLEELIQTLKKLTQSNKTYRKLINEDDNVLQKIVNNYIGTREPFSLESDRLNSDIVALIMGNWESSPDESKGIYKDYWKVWQIKNLINRLLYLTSKHKFYTFLFARPEIMKMIVNVYIVRRRGPYRVIQDIEKTLDKSTNKIRNSQALKSELIGKIKNLFNNSPIANIFIQELVNDAEFNKILSEVRYQRQLSFDSDDEFPF